MNPAILKWVNSNKVYIELLLVLAVLIATWFNYNNPGTVQEVLMGTMILLASFYFLLAYVPRDIPVISVFEVVGLNVIDIASSVCIIGLLFTILHLSGAAQMLVIGTLSFGPAALLVLYYAVKGGTTKARIPLFIRIIVLGGVSVQTLFHLLNVNPG